MIEARGPTCALDASSLIIFSGPTFRAVYWSLTGAGTLTPITDYTDERGMAYAKYFPDNNLDEVVTIGVSYGL